MFDGKEDCLILRRNITFLQFRDYLRKGAISCLNPSHKNTIREIERRYEILLPTPDSPVRIKLRKGDTMIIITSRGLPRKTGNIIEFTEEELEQATFNFSTYTLLKNN